MRRVFRTSRRSLVGVVPLALLADVAGLAVPAEASSGGADRPAMPFEFNRDGYPWHDLPVTWRPYVNGVVIPKKDKAPHDGDGVRMYLVGDKRYDHPTGQAQYGLKNLEAYLLTKDRFFLDRARKQAQRLIDTKVESNDGWFYPFGFHYDMHQKNKWWIRAPWYSGMAQGQALSLFVRLAEVDASKAAKWRDAANRTFTSFFTPRNLFTPWVVHKDGTGHIWFEEYAKWQLAGSDRTFNGHVFAVFGLWDYYRLTKDPQALALYDGGITTINHYYERGQRTPGFTSLYCLAHQVPSPKYHRIHIEQYVYLWLMTRQQKFVEYADTLADDYPYPYVVPDRRVELAARTHTAYTFNLKSGSIRSIKNVTLTEATTVSANLRQRIFGRGVYYHVTSGELKDHWIAESVTRGVQMWGASSVLRYFRRRQATFAGGRRYTGHKYDRAGNLLAHKTAMIPENARASYDTTAWIMGSRHVRIVSGPLDGYWIADTDLIFPPR